MACVTEEPVRIIEWDEYTRMLEKLHTVVLEQLYNCFRLRSFDGIVAIGRGGMIIAAYLASKLGIPAFYPVFIRSTGRGKEMKIIVDDLGQVQSLKGRLLVVDDWLDEGRTMKLILNLFPKERRPQHLSCSVARDQGFSPISSANMLKTRRAD